MPNKILILFAHPSQHRSEINLPLIKASSSLQDVTVVDLYAEYPDYSIDIEREQQRLREHNVIVFMFPLYWYSTPAILKETYHAALDMGCEALTRLGFHPFRAEQLKNTFTTTENETVEDMYESWVASTDHGMTPDYRELFMQQEAAIRAAMQGDRSDRHSVSERGWNPPPKGYTEQFSQDTARETNKDTD